MSERQAVARQILERAIAGRVFPAASVDVGSSAGSLWSDVLGTLTFDENAPPATLDTPFDLASLTKVIATTTIMMELVRAERVRLTDPVSAFFPEWRGPERAAVTLEHLLEHASGLAPRLVGAPPHGRREFEHEICQMRLDYPAGSQSVYSDLDFILLGFLAADRGAAPLAVQFDEILRCLEPRRAALTFKLPAQTAHLAAPTMALPSDSRRGHLLVAEVHDDYAAALGGVAGHAGLFGTARAVGDFARIVLRAARGATDGPAPFSPDLVARFATRSTVSGSSRALGWDTMLPTSSCGTRMSREAFGQVGFTGTSLWIDPPRDRYFVLLSNRACGGGSSDDMRAVRRAFHDTLADL